MSRYVSTYRGVISQNDHHRQTSVGLHKFYDEVPPYLMKSRTSYRAHEINLTFMKSPSPDLNLTPLAAFLRFLPSADRNLPLFMRWVRHKNGSHPNHSMSATILSTCYASTESLGVSELNDTNIKYFGVPGRISRAVESTNFTTIVFTLPHIMVPKFANQLPIRNVGRTCNGSGNVWNWESRSRCTGTLENTAPHKICCDNFFLF